MKYKKSKLELDHVLNKLLIIHKSRILNPIRKLLNKAVPMQFTTRCTAKRPISMEKGRSGQMTTKRKAVLMKGSKLTQILTVAAAAVSANL